MVKLHLFRIAQSFCAKRPVWSEIAWLGDGALPSEIYVAVAGISPIRMGVINSIWNDNCHK